MLTQRERTRKRRARLAKDGIKDWVVIAHKDDIAYLRGLARTLLYYRRHRYF